MLTRLGLVTLLLSSASPAVAEQFFVRNQGEYAQAHQQIEAGDSIVLASGEWRDFELVITGTGSKDKPITVTAEKAGTVFLTGQSSLRIGGEYILVTGLVFKDGYSPRGEVISFRVNKDDQARHSRVTAVVIDNFSKPDRYDDDYWVGIYGHRNRFDHNHLVGKTNKGVTLAVRLDTEESRDNGHHIDHNYFGPRPVLGSNGGETIRIGTSTYSMFSSGTIVEDNVFDRTDGEVEIISSKSGGNTYRGNLFLRSRGSLTLRHGDDNLVERNVFLGHGKDYTGGIRVINRNHTVRNNYMEGLRGTGFSSALTVMNGVPNSPVHRYVQVENARIENNSVIESARITLGGGADDERSAPPIGSVFRNNLLGGVGARFFIQVDADMSGIDFENNTVVAGKLSAGFRDIVQRSVELARAANGLLYPVDPATAGMGAPRDLDLITLDEVGVDWYPKPGDGGPFGTSGKIIEVAPGIDTLVEAAALAGAGDTLMLAPGEYLVDRTIPLDKALTIKGGASEDNGRSGAIIRFSRPSLIELQEGGNLQLANLVVDGELAPDSVGNAMVRTSTFPIQSNFQIELDGVTVRNLVVNKSFHVLALGKSVMADRITIRNSSFSGISGTVVSAAAETEDYGQYNVDHLEIVNSSFANIGGPIADIYRGGTDESTFGPFVEISGNALTAVGKAATNGSGASINLHGVQTVKIARNAVSQSAPVRVVHTVGVPNTSISGNSFAETGRPILLELVFEGGFRAAMAQNTLDGANIP